MKHSSKGISNAVLDAVTETNPYRKRSKAIGLIIIGALLFITGVGMAFAYVIKKTDINQIIALIGIGLIIISIAFWAPGIAILVKATKEIKKKKNPKVEK